MNGLIQSIRRASSRQNASGSSMRAAVLVARRRPRRSAHCAPTPPAPDAPPPRSRGVSLMPSPSTPPAIPVGVRRARGGGGRRGAGRARGLPARAGARRCSAGSRGGSARTPRPPCARSAAARRRRRSARGPATPVVDRPRRRVSSLFSSGPSVGALVSSWRPSRRRCRRPSPLPSSSLRGSESRGNSGRCSAALGCSLRSQ